MNLIYIHGLDSDANSTKGMLLEKYCQHHHPDINVLRPDLNQSPQDVFDKLISLVEEWGSDSKVVFVGSSLGGYFSTLVSNHTGCAALLLNPSTQPHVTLQRFAHDLLLNNDSNEGQGEDELPKNQILYTTTGGWDITSADLQWFADHQLSEIHYPKKIAVFIKEGDELLNPELSKAFYQQQGSTVILQAGGDHRFSDFGEQLPMVINMLQDLV
ncbi:MULTISPECIES: YqiA/YcfP family alpha/beta fold hydrolase [unclassified Psychrobacter]|uniref:YqiA/YcfP family alpha/beta fold hydrolase n=1 Tax=unclassified Psychrobacter TaxID=196806 RepID=UPI0025CC011F|nr:MULTISPECIES: YqiA/YcfP family alpha/beta fold hydrolase [unclassified Psychrobacter]